MRYKKKIIMKFLSSTVFPVFVTTFTSLASAQTCPITGQDPKVVVFVGNSYTGGRSVGRACPSGSDDPGLTCRQSAIPGNVRSFFTDPTETYPYESDSIQYDVRPDSDSLINPSGPGVYNPDYNPFSNPHKGDVPGKIKLLSDYFCSSPPTGDLTSMTYLQNSQSAMTTRTHSGQSSAEEKGTLRLLGIETTGNIFEHYPKADVVVVQPRSTEYINPTSNDLDNRKDALVGLFVGDASKPNRKYILQQTWPRREDNNYNPLCTCGGKEGKEGVLEEIDATIAAFRNDANIPPFVVAPTGNAFVEFAKFACPGILADNASCNDGTCTYSTSVSCGIFFGEVDKISLYDELVSEDGTHQSEEIGAWLAAAVLMPIIQNADDPCYISASALEKVMPTIDSTSLASYPASTTLSIYQLIAQAAQKALTDEFGSISMCSSGSPTGSAAPSLSPTDSGTCSADTAEAGTRCTVDADCGACTTRRLVSFDRKLQCLNQACSNKVLCCDGYECQGKGKNAVCKPLATPSPSTALSFAPSGAPTVSVSPSASPSDQPSLKPAVTPPVFCGCVLPTNAEPSAKPSLTPSGAPTLPPTAPVSCSDFRSRGDCENNGYSCTSTNNNCGTCVDLANLLVPANQLG